jgi:hypothetical protein
LALFIKYIWLSIIRSLKWHYFVQTVQFTDINPCIFTAVHAAPNTYHAIFPEKRLALRWTV